MSTSNKVLGGIAVAIMAWPLLASPAMATDGYFAHGFGARQKALGGAGVADGNDATSGELNPAGLVHIERSEFSMSVSGFSPRRGFSATAGGAVLAGQAGNIDSNKNWFAIPNMAFAYRTVDNPYLDVVGFTVAANGGLNTQYPSSAGPFGVFNGATVPGGGRQAGVNLEQAIISVTMAKKLGPLSIGLAPGIVRQQFRATGLEAFGVLDRDDDVVWGFGLRYGLEYEVSENFRVGLAGSTRYKMSRFKKYASLFAQRGDFDIPATIQAGVAVDVTEHLTFMADYKHIWYSDVKAIANPSANFLTNGLGGEQGAGFGWKDIDIIKLGVEWEATDDLTLRAGYSYNTSPIRPADVTFNILATATVQHHITGGFEYEINDTWSVEGQGMYAPEGSITGNNLPVGGSSPAARQTIRMKQYEITAGIKYKFGAEED